MRENEGTEVGKFGKESRLQAGQWEPVALKTGAASIWEKGNEKNILRRKTNDERGMCKGKMGGARLRKGGPSTKSRSPRSSLTRGEVRHHGRQCDVWVGLCCQIHVPVTMHR
jgi:hypothetical protein